MTSSSCIFPFLSLVKHWSFLCVKYLNPVFLICRRTICMDIGTGKQCEQTPSSICQDSTFVLLLTSRQRNMPLRYIIQVSAWQVCVCLPSCIDRIITYRKCTLFIMLSPHLLLLSLVLILWVFTAPTTSSSSPFQVQENHPKSDLFKLDIRCQTILVTWTYPSYFRSLSDLFRKLPM